MLIIDTKYLGRMIEYWRYQIARVFHCEPWGEQVIKIHEVTK